jgi:hypothetical protein
MTRRVLVATRLAILLVAITTAAGCSHAPAYHLKVDSKVAPFKPADPDDLVVDDGSDDEDDEDEAPGDAGEE